MKILLIAVSLLMVTAANAQVGVGTSTANSASGAVSRSGVAINTPANTTAKVNSVPTSVAPGLAAAGIETCLGSVAGGGSFLGGGFNFGTTVPDTHCDIRLTARQLDAMGHKAAAMALMCHHPDVRQAMLETGTPCPQDLAAVAAARAGGTRAAFAQVDHAEEERQPATKAFLFLKPMTPEEEDRWMR